MGLLHNSQAGKLNKKMSMQTPPTDSIVGRELLLLICKLVIFKDSVTYPKRMKQISLICTTKNGMITKMTVAEMERIFKTKVEAVLYCHDQLDCLLDPMVIAELTLWHPPMKSFISQNTATIYLKYVVPIDITTTSELINYFGILSGMATMLFDGVMVNRKSKVRWLLPIPHCMTLYMKSQYQIFIFYIQC
jgi:hypothetical protein